MAAETHGAAFRPRSRFGLAGIFFGLSAGPVAWFVQLVANYALDSHPCYPHEFPLVHPLPGWQWAGSGRLAINIAAIVLALAASAVSLRILREMRQDHPAEHNDVLPPAIGRTRFLAASGVMIGLGSVAVIIFDLVALMAVPPCLG